MNAPADSSAAIAEPLQDWPHRAALSAVRERTTNGEAGANEAATVWDGLVTAHWSLVDRFDRDGSRHLLLRRNSPAERASATLTSREASVVGYAVLGHSNKQMAYELGVSQSNVSECLRRACAKLGVGTRAGLMDLVSTELATYVGTETHVMLSFPLPRPESVTPAVLTASEQCVFRALLTGQSNAQIAASRGRSPRTIANQVAAVFRKLAVGSRSELLTTHALRASVHSFSVSPFSSSPSPSSLRRTRLASTLSRGQRRLEREQGGQSLPVPGPPAADDSFKRQRCPTSWRGHQARFSSCWSEQQWGRYLGRNGRTRSDPTAPFHAAMVGSAQNADGTVRRTKGRLGIEPA
jgi:DNA-binding NarL/FixJ family response regulator